MTDLEQLTKELAMVKSRETDPLYELVEPEVKPEPRMPEGWVKDCLNGFVPVKASTPKSVPERNSFGCKTLIGDQELLRKTEVDLVEESFHKMFREMSTVMAASNYIVDPDIVHIDVDRNERLCATELTVRVVGEEPLEELSVAAMSALNIGYLKTALRNKYER